MEKPIKAELIKGDYIFDLTITPEMESKIRLACSKFPNNEWSGVLFYKYDGTFKDSNLKITCVDFLVMDVGTQTFTEWKMNTDVIGYMCDNDLVDCQFGLIHSHDTMASYFSSTDLNTLLEEGKDSDNVLSLIVNNAGQYVAAITRFLTTESTVKERNNYNFFGNEKKTTFTGSYTSVDYYVEYFMANITVGKEDNPYLTFMNRLVEIADKKKTENTVNMWGYNKPIPVQQNLRIEKPLEANAVYPVDNSSVDKAMVMKCVAQIITGDILASEKTINLKTFITTQMDKLFDSRFGTATDTKSPYSLWLEGMIESIIYDNGLVGAAVKDTCPDEYDKETIFGQAVFDALLELDKNIMGCRHMKAVIDKFKQYMLY